MLANINNTIFIDNEYYDLKNGVTNNYAYWTAHMITSSNIQRYTRFKYCTSTRWFKHSHKNLKKKDKHNSRHVLFSCTFPPFKLHNDYSTKFNLD